MAKHWMIPQSRQDVMRTSFELEKSKVGLTRQSISSRQFETL